MRPSDYQPGHPGEVIEAGPTEGRYWAFVPDPLPPDMVFAPELVSALSAADRALGELRGRGDRLPNPRLLIGPIVKAEAVKSSRIEGTRANVQDLYAFEAGQKALPGMDSGAPESDVREVLNYLSALDFGLVRVHTLPVSLRLTRGLHALLLRDVRGKRATPGEFRRSQNWIDGSSPVDARYVPPPADHRLDVSLGDLEAYVHANDEWPPLLRLALVHYQFEAIHPFLDGNGRIGRLLNSLLLVHWDLLPLPLLYLSEYLERHRDEYFDRLHGVATAVLTITRAAELLDVQYPSASRSVDRLVDYDILEPVDPSAKYDRLFYAREILHIAGATEADGGTEQMSTN